MNSSKLKSIYVDICNGYSISGGFFIKHLLPQDEIICDDEYEKILEEVIKAGFKSDDEIIKEAIQSGKWSEREDRAIKSIEEDYRRLSMARYRPTSVLQLIALKEELREIEKSWSELIIKKSNLTQDSAEKFALKCKHEKFVYVSLYKDKDLRELAFKDEFEYLSDDYVDKLTGIVLGVNNKISTENIKLLAIEPMLQGRISLSEDGYYFFNKPLYLLTKYQIDLIKLSYKYKTMLSECGDIPDDFEGPDGIEDFFYLKRNNALPTAEDIARNKSMWA